MRHNPTGIVDKIHNYVLIHLVMRNEIGNWNVGQWVRQLINNFQQKILIKLFLLILTTIKKIKNWNVIQSVKQLPNVTRIILVTDMLVWKFPKYFT